MSKRNFNAPVDVQEGLPAFLLVTTRVDSKLDQCRSCSKSDVDYAHDVVVPNFVVERSWCRRSSHYIEKGACKLLGKLRGISNVVQKIRSGLTQSVQVLGRASADRTSAARSDQSDHRSFAPLKHSTWCPSHRPGIFLSSQGRARTSDSPSALRFESPTSDQSDLGLMDQLLSIQVHPNALVYDYIQA